MFRRNRHRQQAVEYIGSIWTDVVQPTALFKIAWFVANADISNAQTPEPTPTLNTSTPLPTNGTNHHPSEGLSTVSVEVISGVIGLSFCAVLACAGVRRYQKYRQEHAAHHAYLSSSSDSSSDCEAAEHQPINGYTSSARR